MNPLSLKYKITAVVFSLFLIAVPLSTINDVYEVPGGVYICGQLMCDPTPSHLSYYCDNFHQLFWEVK